jgi:hypothetical protein
MSSRESPSKYAKNKKKAWIKESHLNKLTSNNSTKNGRRRREIVVFLEIIVEAEI